MSLQEIGILEDGEDSLGLKKQKKKKKPFEFASQTVFLVKPL